MMRRILLCIFLLAFILVASPAAAQVKSTDVTLLVNPETPSPNQNVEARLSSFVTDLSKAYMVWSINGKKVSQGIGKISLNFNSGNIGNSNDLSVSIELVDGESLKKSVLVTTSTIDMVWEAVDSYTPPFYKGKALGVQEGSYKVTAIPNVYIEKVKVSPNNLSYTWKRNGTPQPGSSGWGKSAYNFSTSFLDRSVEVEVTVADISGNTVGKSKTIVPTNTPKIVFYKKDQETKTPIYEKSLNTETIISGSGITIVAEPYFFSRKKFFEGSLNFRWFLGNQEVSNVNEIKNEINVKGEEGKSGQARVRLLLENTAHLYETADRVLNVIF